MAGEAAAVSDQEVRLLVSLLGGEELAIDVDVRATVADVKQKVVALKPPPAGQALKLLSGTAALADTDHAAPLAGCVLTALFTTSEFSYRALSADKSHVVLLGPGDPDYSEDASTIANRWVPGSAGLVPAPEAFPGCSNLARESFGATAVASSNIWGDGPEAQEKLSNVLRLGALHGDPRYVGGDSSFIFSEGEDDQELVVDLGRVVVLVRVGSACYGDRWLDSFAVHTRAEEEEEWRVWGESRRNMEGDTEVFFDHESVRARFVRFRCSSGHYFKAGARLGPVFAYGWEERDGPAALA